MAERKDRAGSEAQAWPETEGIAAAIMRLAADPRDGDAWSVVHRGVRLIVDRELRGYLRTERDDVVHELCIEILTGRIKPQVLEKGDGATRGWLRLCAQRDAFTIVVRKGRLDRTFLSERAGETDSAGDEGCPAKSPFSPSPEHLARVLERAVQDAIERRKRPRDRKALEDALERLWAIHVEGTSTEEALERYEGVGASATAAERACRGPPDQGH